MKIGNLRIKWHKHKWKKVVLHVDERLPSSLAQPGYMLKVAEECVHPDCDHGAYRSIYWIYLKDKPDVIKID